MKYLFIACMALLTVACSSGRTSTSEQEKKRIVSLNGSITEILYELGVGDQVVGVDVTSTFPEDAKNKQQLGHLSRLNIEQIVALKPTHLFLFEDELNPQLEQQLKAVSIGFTALHREFSIKGIKAIVEQIAVKVQREDEGKRVIENITKATTQTFRLNPSPKVLFIYARGAGTLMVAGEGTPVEKVIQLAGAKNAAVGFQEYKPLTSEAVVAANPDVILMFDSGAQSLGQTSVFDLPGVAQTNAGKNKRLLTMDGQLLSGFGPRIGKAINELNSKLKQ